MTAPSIKEALETAPTVVDQLERVLPRLKDDIVAGFAVDCAIGTLKALATFQPDGERREAIARIIDPRSHQKYDDAYRRKDRHDQMVWIGGVNKAREKADLILASGLVQDEAGIRRDEREKCAKICSQRARKHDLKIDPEDKPSLIFATMANEADDCAESIRSARDGGAET